MDRRELIADLRDAVRGDVRFDAASRVLYATDAANYRHVPIGLVVPHDVDDAVEEHPDHRLLADGFSCREQIRRLTGRRARHLAELLADAI